LQQSDIDVQQNGMVGRKKGMILSKKEVRRGFRREF
jgi:hypothetical protein